MAFDDRRRPTDPRHDPPDGLFTRPPRFAELSPGLVSSAPDVLRFMSAMADGGGPVLSPAPVARMTADALTDTQRRQAFVDPTRGTSACSGPRGR